MISRTYSDLELVVITNIACELLMVRGMYLLKKKVVIVRYDISKTKKMLMVSYVLFLLQCGLVLPLLFHEPICIISEYCIGGLFELLA